MAVAMFLFLLATFHGSLALTGGDMHFMGGSMTFKFTDTTQAPYKLKITTMTGWVLGKGPCGPSCSSADVGRSTTKTRQYILASKGMTYFGNWTREVPGARHSRETVITPEVTSNIEGRVSAVNIPLKWEQEIAEVTIDIDPKAEYTDISFKGFYWRWFNYTFGVHGYRVQVKIKPTARTDTMKPNSSPVVLFHQVYRISLNKATTIKLSTLDPDGDVVECSMAEFVDSGGLGILNNTVVNPDCSIVIDAQESAGFLDGGWGTVAVRALDSPRHSKFDSYGSHMYLSTINIQFMIQTLATIEPPEFVTPTVQSRHKFIVYVGSTLKILLYARPVSANEIDSFHLKSIPYRPFTIDSLKEDFGRTGERIKYTIVNWRPGKSDVGEYIVSALVTDTQGMDGLDRNYIIIVKDIELPPQTDVPNRGPYFPLFPTMVECMIATTCSFPVYSNTRTPGGFISDVNITTSSIATTTIDPPETTTRDGTAIFVSVVTVNPTKSGDQKLCFEAMEDLGKTSNIKCLGVEVKFPDPCSSDPCVYGNCNSQGDSYFCSCIEQYTGRNCENEIAACESHPCQNNGKCSENGPRRFLCDCSGTGFVGPLCEKDEVDCKPGACLPYGACRDLNGKFECDCYSGYSGDDCRSVDIKCQNVTCKNGGICIVETGSAVCKCPFGFSGPRCNVAHVIQEVNSGTTDLPFIVPSLANGAEIECFIHQTCTIPVYSHIPIHGIPEVEVGLHSPAVTASIQSTKPDPTIGPNTVISLLSVTPNNTGLHTVCLNAGGVDSDTLCYKVNASTFKAHPPFKQQIPRFLKPTLTDQSIINCIQGTPCHAIFTTDINYFTGKNCTLYSGSTSAIVFKALISGRKCETDVLFIPPATGDSEVCLQAGQVHIANGDHFQGEKRCFHVKSTAKDSCNPNPCSNGGACIIQPGRTPPFQCICPDTATGDRCQDKKNCLPSPCHNGGFCESKGDAYECRCPVGYGGHDCASLTNTTDALFTDPTLHNGATVVCEAGATCDIPVFLSRASILLAEGPKEGDIEVEYWKFIGKGGASHEENQLRVTPLTVGVMKVCMKATSGATQMSEVVCYHIKADKGTLVLGLDDFKSPTLPAGTTIPCAANKQCHVIMYSRPDGHTCQQVEDYSSAGLTLYIFPSQLEGASCVTDVMFSSDGSTGLRNLCLGLGSSTQRCYKVDPITSEPCRNQNCGHGACIVEGDSHACVCDEKHRGPSCQIDIDVPVVG